MRELSVKQRGLLREVAKILGLLVLLVLLMMWLAGTFKHKVAPGPVVEPAEPSSARTQPVEERPFTLFVEQVGTVRTRSEAQVSSRVMAQVREILVNEGDVVQGPEATGEKATVLARLDDRDVQARIRQAESQVAAMEGALESALASLRAAKSRAEAARSSTRVASADYDRYRELQRNRAATGQQVDHARSRYQVAEAELQAALQAVAAAESEIRRAEAQKAQSEAALAEAHVAQSYTAAQAPFTGRIVRKLVDVGDTVAPGQPLFIIETPSQPELHAVVSESLLPDIQTGQTMEVRIDALDRSLQGTVREITPRADPSTRTVLVKVSLPARPDLVAGLFGRLLIPMEEYHALVVPREAVREVGQLQLVEVLDEGGRPVRRFVTLGRYHGDVVEVLSGLRKGEEVVVP